MSMTGHLTGHATRAATNYECIQVLLERFMILLFFGDVASTIIGLCSWPRWHGLPACRLSGR